MGLSSQSLDLFPANAVSINQFFDCCQTKEIKSLLRQGFDLNFVFTNTEGKRFKALYFVSSSGLDFSVSKIWG